LTHSVGIISDILEDNITKNWTRTGSGYWFDFYYEIFLRVIQNVTNNRGSVFLLFFYFVSMCCTHHNQW